MNMVKLAANVDENQRLSVQVPNSIPPGPVTVLVLPVSAEDHDSNVWTAAIAEEWADELSDPWQDIYTLATASEVDKKLRTMLDLEE